MKTINIWFSFSDLTFLRKLGLGSKWKVSGFTQFEEFIGFPGISDRNWDFMERHESWWRPAHTPLMVRGRDEDEGGFGFSSSSRSRRG